MQPTFTQLPPTAPRSTITTRSARRRAAMAAAKAPPPEPMMASSGRVLGVHLLADGAGDAILAGVYAIENRRTVTDLAHSWDPYLTTGEAIHLAALSFTRDPGKLSCCAA